MTMPRKALALSAAVLALSACNTMLPPAKDLGPSDHYLCGDTPVATFSGEDGATHLNVSGDMYPMISSQTIYGIKYENLNGHPVVSFWDKGETAILEVDGKTYPSCRKVQDTSKMEIKDYRGIGNNPAWFLMIRDGQLVFNSHYRERIVMADLPEPRAVASGQSYDLKTGSQDMRVTITHRACRDTLTRRYYPDQINILFYGQELTGCGNEISEKDNHRDLQEMTAEKQDTLPKIADTTKTVAPREPAPLSAYTGKTWIVQQIDGAGVVPPVRPTLTFNNEGLFIGNGGCNQFSGTFRIDDRQLHIDPLMVETKKSCSPDLSKQEKILTSILKASTLIEVRDDTLIVSTPHRKTIMLKQEGVLPDLVILP